MRNKWWAWGCAVWMACAPLAAQNLQKGDYGYLYCHMSGRGEWTAYALSRDGLHYEDLLGGDPVYDVEKLSPIEGGARDAYICRTYDGKGYVMVTTDMSNRKSRSWFNHGIDLLRSDDLIHWESVAFDFRKGPSVFSDPDSPDVYCDYTGIKRVWAPQIFWDPAYVWPDGTKGGYMIYYSLWNPEEEKYDRMYYSYADHSFTTLTKPRLMFDWGYATIDADINYISADGKYHMLIKKEGGTPGIFAAVADKLTAAGLRVKFDDRDNVTPGWKFNEWELKGVPVRVEVGPRDLAEGKVLSVRRDTFEKAPLDIEGLEGEIKAMLDAIQTNMFEIARAFRDEHTADVHSMEELEKQVNGGYAKAMWCGEQACEDEIKDRFSASSRCMPFDQTPIGETCVCCGKPAKKVIYFAKAY